jgi:hypothetical protein
MFSFHPIEVLQNNFAGKEKLLKMQNTKNKSYFLEKQNQEIYLHDGRFIPHYEKERM